MSIQPATVLRIANGVSRPRTRLQRNFVNWLRTKDGHRLYRAFCAYANKLSLKHDHFSADAIFHTIRTRRALRGLPPYPKMSNDLVAYAARLYTAQYGGNLFRLRRVSA